MSRRSEYLQRQALNRAVKMTMDIILSSMTVALKKEFGFGQGRIEKALKAVEAEITPIGTGMIGYDQYKEYAEDFTGVRIKGVTERED